jgi:hypothetical protein
VSSVLLPSNKYGTIKMLKHRVWNSVSNILFSDVKGGGQNDYRDTKIRLTLTLMKRIGWIKPKHVSHFEMTLWQDATIAIEDGMWCGTKREAIQYYFWTFVASESRRMATRLGTADADKRIGRRAS